MQPITNQRGRLMASLGYVLANSLSDGHPITNCSIDTAKGVKVADVAWTSAEFIGQFGYETPYRKASEICGEILSPSNTMMEMEEKIVLYLAKGAKEVWLCNLEGQLSFYGNEGEFAASVLAPDFPPQI